MKTLSTNQLVQTIRDAERGGDRFCFILGAGASAESGIPTGRQLENRWMACLMGEQPDMDGSEPYKKQEDLNCTVQQLNEAKLLKHDFAEIRKEWEAHKAEPNWMLPSQYYFDLFKIRFFHNQRLGYYYLEQVMENVEPSFGYHPLALMLAGGHNLAITTNFDSLLEKALYLYTDRDPLVINHEDQASYIVKQQPQRPIIAKVHRGLFYDPFNSPEDTNQLNEKWKDVLKSAFDRYTLVVIGYGGGDHSLMDFLQQPDTRIPRGLYWCYHEAAGQPEGRIQQMVEDKGGYFVSIAGFDALMLAIGQAFYPDKILSHAIENRANRQIQKYEETRQKAIEASKAQNGPENAEFRVQLQALDQREQEGEARRESQGQLTPWDHIRRGDRHYHAGAYVEAIAEYTQAIQQDPKLAAAYNNRGVAHADLGEYDKAIEDYTQAIAQAPKLTAAYKNRGNAYRKLKQYDKAVDDYTQAISLDSKDAMAYYDRGNAYSCLGKYAKTIEDYTRFLGLNPQNAMVYNNRGLAYADLGEYEKAIEDYTCAVDLEDKFAVAYNNRGYAYAKLGKYPEAIADYDQAIKLNPELTGAYYNRGGTYADLGEYDKAIKDYTQAITLDPELAMAYNNRGFVQYYLKQYPAAVKDFTLAIKYAPMTAAFYINRAKVYRALGQEDKAEADEERVKKLGWTGGSNHR